MTVRRFSWSFSSGTKEAEERPHILDMCMRCTILKEMNDYVKVGQKGLRRNKGGVVRNASEKHGG